MQSSLRSAQSTEPEVCPACMRAYDSALNSVIPFAGSNQFSPYKVWQGHQVTALQYLILKNIRKTTEERLASGVDEPLRHSQALICERVYGKHFFIVDPLHALRQQVYRLRHKLKGWRIDRNDNGYLLVKEGED